MKFGQQLFFLHAQKLGHGTNYFNFHPKEGMLFFFQQENSDGFGRERTRDLGVFEPATLRLVAWCL
jgi:hypothetical protein